MQRNIYLKGVLHLKKFTHRYTIRLKKRGVRNMGEQVKKKYNKKKYK